VLEEVFPNQFRKKHRELFCPTGPDLALSPPPPSLSPFTPTHQTHPPGYTCANQYLRQLATVRSWADLSLYSFFTGGHYARLPTHGRHIRLQHFQDAFVISLSPLLLVNDLLLNWTDYLSSDNRLVFIIFTVTSGTFPYCLLIFHVWRMSRMFRQRDRETERQRGKGSLWTLWKS